MPTKGYATVGIKPAILLKLEKDTDEYYPGIFLPSALIIMNEIKRGLYSVETDHWKMDYSGRYTSLTIREDVKTWLKENYEFNKEEYSQNYKTRNFTQFASFFMLNMFKSKSKSHKYVVNIKESDFLWLQDEYKNKNEEYREKNRVYNFDQFADFFIKDIFEKLNEAKKLLTW